MHSTFETVEEIQGSNAYFKVTLYARMVMPIYNCALISRKCASHLMAENPRIKNAFKKAVLIHAWSDEALKNTVVNRALPSLYGSTSVPYLKFECLSDEWTPKW